MAQTGIVWRHEVDLSFKELAFRIPEPGRGALGDKLEPVVPGPFANGAQRTEPLFEKVDESGGGVGKALQFHRDS
jgi:hypothetical protein